MLRQIVFPNGDFNSWIDLKYYKSSPLATIPSSASINFNNNTPTTSYDFNINGCSSQSFCGGNAQNHHSCNCHSCSHQVNTTPTATTTFVVPNVIAAAPGPASTVVQNPVNDNNINISNQNTSRNNNTIARVHLDKKNEISNVNDIPTNANINRLAEEISALNVPISKPVAVRQNTCQPQGAVAPATTVPNFKIADVLVAPTAHPATMTSIFSPYQQHGQQVESIQRETQGFQVPSKYNFDYEHRHQTKNRLQHLRDLIHDRKTIRM